MTDNQLKLAMNLNEQRSDIVRRLRNVAEQYDSMKGDTTRLAAKMVRSAQLLVDSIDFADLSRMALENEE